MKHWQRHIAAALGSTAIAQVCAGIAQVTIVRTLGVTGYGTYSVVYAWLAIAGSVVSAGLDTWLLDSQSRQSSVSRQTVWRIVQVKTTLWLLCLAAALGGIGGVEPVFIVLGFGGLLGDTLTQTWYQVFRSQNRHHTVATYSLLAPIAVLGAVGSGMVTDLRTLLTLACLVSLGTCLFVGARLWTLLRATPQPAPIPVRALGRFVVSDLCAQLYSQSGTLILAAALTTTAVGVYRGAWSIVGYSFVVPALLFQTTLPHLNAADGRERSAVLRRSLWLYAVYGAVMAAATAWVAGPIVATVYGDGFSDSATLVAAFWVIPLCKAVSFAAAMILVHAQALPRRIAVQAVVVAVVWLVTPLLIAQYGLEGAIQAQILTEAVLAVGYAVMALSVLDLLPAARTPPRRIALTNLHGVGNLGDVAIHQAQHALLRRVVPGATITARYAVPPTTPTSADQVVQSVAGWVYTATGAISPLRTRVRKAVVYGYALQTGRWNRCWWGLTAGERASLQALQAADVVIASGGGYLYDGEHAQPLRRFVGWDWWLLGDLVLAICWGRPVLFFPQSIGPITSPWYRCLLSWVLRRARHIWVRDGASAALLVQWGIPYSQTVDLAWATVVPPPLPTADDRPHLGMTVIDWGAQYAGFAGQAAYEAALVTVGQRWVADGGRVTLYVQAIEHAPAWDDRGVAARVAAQIPGAEIVSGFRDPLLLARAYAGLDCLIATRMHSAILRLCSGRPCVVIGYLPKARSMMDDLGLADFFLDIAHLDAGQLAAVVRRSMHEKSRCAAISATTAAALEQFAATLADECSMDRHRPTDPA